MKLNDLHFILSLSLPLLAVEPRKSSRSLSRVYARCHALARPRAGRLPGVFLVSRNRSR